MDIFGKLDLVAYERIIKTEATQKEKAGVKTIIEEIREPNSCC